MPRWNHPDYDWGILSKLNSQATRFAQEKKWADDMHSKINKHRTIMAAKAEEEERIRRETKLETVRNTARDSDGYTIPSVRSASSMDDHHELYGAAEGERGAIAQEEVAEP